MNNRLRAVVRKSSALGGFKGFLLLAAAILMDETISVLIGGDTGGFLWVTFHFILNPVLCIAFVICAAVKAILVEQLSVIVIGLILSALALGYVYLSASGNIEWIQFLGISFQ